MRIGNELGFVGPSAGGGGGTGVAIVPTNTYFVSPTFTPAGSKPPFFTGLTALADAIAAAIAAGASDSNRFLILIYPGAYAAPAAPVDVGGIDIASADSDFPVTVNGIFSFAPTGGTSKTFHADGINFVPGFSVDTTGMTGASVGGVRLKGCDGAITATARPASGDFINVFAQGLGASGPSSISLGSITAAIMDSSFTAVSSHANSATFNDCLASGPVSLSSPGSPLLMIWNGGQITGPSVTITGGSITMCACDLLVSFVVASPGTAAIIRDSNITGTLTGGGVFDIRSSWYNLTIPFAAAAVDRSTFIFTFGPTAVGANAVTFAGAGSVPYLDAAYEAHLTDITGAGGGATVSVTVKTAAGFTLNDPTGGRTFSISIIKP